MYSQPQASVVSLLTVRLRTSLAKGLLKCTPFYPLTAGEETGEEAPSSQVRDRGGNGTQPSFPSSPLFSRDEVNLTQPDWRKAPDTFKVIVTVAFAGKLYSMS